MNDRHEILERRWTNEMRGYKTHGYTFPDSLIEGMVRYVVYGIEPGSFLVAVLENDLHEAVSNADADNLKTLPVIPIWLYNVAPMGCWGSYEHVQNWMKFGGLFGGADVLQ